MFDALENWFTSLNQMIDQWLGLASTLPTPEAPTKPSRGPSLSNLVKSLLGLNSWTFYIPFQGPRTGAQIEALLGRHGIKMTSRGIVRGDIYFSVKLTQAEWAEYLMLKAGIPLKYGLYSAHNRRYFPNAAQQDTTSRMTNMASRVLRTFLPE
jgi:hypothetical protein